MLIKTIEEVRLYIPNHRLDDIQGLKGYIDSSERDFLADKLGMELYTSFARNTIPCARKNFSRKMQTSGMNGTA